MIEMERVMLDVNVGFDYITDCGENITDVSSGFISSPNFPNSYPANSRCIWILRMAPGTRIQFHFTNFSTGPDDTVQVAYVLSFITMHQLDVSY